MHQLDDLAIGIAILAAAVLAGILARYIFFWLLRIYNRHDKPFLVRSLTESLNRPLAFFIPLLFVSVSLTAFPEQMLSGQS